MVWVRSFRVSALEQGFDIQKQECAICESHEKMPTSAKLQTFGGKKNLSLCLLETCQSLTATFSEDSIRTEHASDQSCRHSARLSVPLLFPVVVALSPEPSAERPSRVCSQYSPVGSVVEEAARSECSGDKSQIRWVRVAKEVDWDKEFLECNNIHQHQVSHQLLTSDSEGAS